MQLEFASCTALCGCLDVELKIWPAHHLLPLLKLRDSRKSNFCFATEAPSLSLCYSPSSLQPVCFAATELHSCLHTSAHHVSNCENAGITAPVMSCPALFLQVHEAEGGNQGPGTAPSQLPHQNGDSHHHSQPPNGHAPRAANGLAGGMSVVSSRSLLEPEGVLRQPASSQQQPPGSPEVRHR